jgi:hypothetical protein
MSLEYALVTPITADKADRTTSHLTIDASGLENLDLVSSTPRTAVSAGADYVYNAGPATNNIAVSVRRNYNPKTDVTNNSLRLSTALRETDTVAGTTTDLPCEAVIAWNHRGRLCQNTDELIGLVEMAVSLIFPTLEEAGGHGTAAIFDQYNRGVLTDLW